MSEAVYLLCAVTSVTCAWLLYRGYKRSGARMLYWSSLCFVGLAANNAILFVDLVVVPTIDLSMLRNAMALIALSLLLIGLVLDSR